MTLRAKLGSLPLPRITRFAAVVAIAMAAGHLAQTMAADKPAALPVAEADILPTHIVQLSSGGITDTAQFANPEPHLLGVESPVPAVAPACPVDLSLEAMPLGMIAVEVAAPCHKAERVVLRHAELAITLKLGTDGKMALLLPALTADGAVAVLFGDGARIEDSVAVPDVAGLKRFGVQWQGADAFVLHAMENGADFDQPGDISHKNTGDAGLVAGGVLAVLGDASVETPLLAQIYTYPRDVALKAVGQDPEIVLEAAVLAETCGHDLLGQVMISQSGRVESTDLTLSMPDCSAVGDFLVLKNLASDMKIAAN